MHDHGGVCSSDHQLALVNVGRTARCGVCGLRGNHNGRTEPPEAIVEFVRVQKVLDGSGIPPWRRTLRDEPAKPLSIPSQDPVKHIHERRQSERTKEVAQWSGELDLGEEHDAPTLVARDCRPIAEYEPPTFAAPFLRHRGEQVPGLLIGERKQCQFFTSVKRGDDPRRPTAEPSAAGVEQNQAPGIRRARYARAHVLSKM